MILHIDKICRILENFTCLTIIIAIAATSHSNFSPLANPIPFCTKTRNDLVLVVTILQ